MVLASDVHEVRKPPKSPAEPYTVAKIGYEQMNVEKEAQERFFVGC